MSSPSSPDLRSASKQNHHSSKDLGLDDILQLISGNGIYQKWIIWGMIFPLCMLSGLQGFKQVIYAETPMHWCRGPTSLEQLNMSSLLRKQLTIPLDIVDGTEIYGRCEMYNIDYTYMYSILWNASTLEWTGDNASDLNSVVAYLEQSGFEPKIKWPTVPCKYGWNYDQTDFYSTVVTQWDLVCDQHFLLAVAQFINFFGGMIGVMVFGYVADRFGRRTSIFACLATSVASEALTAVAPSYVVWVIFRFLAGLTYPAIYQVPFILGIELINKQMRIFVTAMTYVFYSIGLCQFCLLAYFIRHWNYLAFATSLPFCLFFIYWRFLPESPRWLHTQGKFDELFALVKKICEANQVRLSEELLASMKTQSTDFGDDVNQSLKNKCNRSPVDLFRTPNMRKKTLLVTLCWLINNSVYGGLNLYGPIMGSNPYMSFGLSALVELPAHIVMIWLMEFWTRRWSIFVLMIIGGVSCIGIMLLPLKDQAIYGLLLYLVGKFSISASFLVIYAFASEIYPTEVRGMGLGLASYSGLFGSLAIPFINLLGYNTLSMPLVVMGGMTVLGSIVVFALPETLHTSFPQTLAEGEEFGKHLSVNEFFSCSRFPKPVEVSGDS